MHLYWKATAGWLMTTPPACCFWHTSAKCAFLNHINACISSSKLGATFSAWSDNTPSTAVTIGAPVVLKKCSYCCGKTLVGVLCSWQILARCLTSGEETSLLGDREGSSHLLKSTWVSWGHFCPDRWAKMWPCGRQQTALVLKMGLWSQFGGGILFFSYEKYF